MSLFWKVLGLIFLAELGDKTQFLMIAMASRYRLRDILLGVAMAVLLLNALAIGIGVLLGGTLPAAAIGVAAGLAFLWFAYSSLDGGEEETNEEAHGMRDVGNRGAAWKVFGTFFLAELGDKTQLTALTLAADSEVGGWTAAELLAILLASSLALFGADVLGLLVGYFLGKTLPNGVFHWLSFFIFAVFGIVKLLGGLETALTFAEGGRWYSIVGTLLVGVMFVGISLHKILKIQKNRDVKHGRT